MEDGFAADARGDYATALRLLRPLAEKGDPVAQFNLGGLYADGAGVPQDYAEAVKWYRLAAEQGSAGAQNSLGAMYENGRGVAKDYVQAHKWYNLAAAHIFPAPTDKVSNALRDKFVKSRDLVAAKMTPAQITEAQKLAREWKPK